MRERTPREVAGAGHGLDTLPKLDSPDYAGLITPVVSGPA